MNCNIPTFKIKRKLITSACILILSVAIISLACSDSKDRSPNIYGTYIIYSDDPQLKRFTEGQDTYIRLNKDKTIVYNSTINYKPKFNFKGNFTFDEKTNTLTIEWKSGKLPDKITVEKKEEDYLIRIGKTVYLKKKPK